MHDECVAKLFKMQAEDINTLFMMVSAQTTLIGDLIEKVKALEADKGK